MTNPTNVDQSPGSLDRYVRRPEIGEMIIVHDKTPWKARVRSYHECAPNCVRVTRAHTTEEWIVPWNKCSPNEKHTRSPASGLLDCPTCGAQPETRNWHTYCPQCGREAAFGDTPWECEQIWNAMIAGQSNGGTHAPRKEKL